LDVYHLGWDESWAIVNSCMAYTNHTLLPEALEKWPVDLFRRLLPRVLEIILEINARFMRQIAFKWPGDTARQSRMSIIEDGPHAQVRMAWLAIVGSFSVNGVAELHSDLLTKTLLKEFYALTPKKFNNKTNGVTQRRWMALCNPGLSDLVDESIGDAWRTDLSQLAELKPLADDSAFRERFDTVKRHNKVELARIVKQECGVDFDPDACFDIQVKRIHEYKRQLLNALHVIHLYSRLKRGDVANWTNRCVLFGGKAAPGYAMAKQIIKFIGNVADVVNNDPDIDGRLKVAYIPNYRVSLMERICPAADLSEQISTAGKEASGTGNMKFMMNGALTIGTLDGANIEIREEVGDDHFFLFGLTTDEITKMRPTYDPRAVIEGNADLSNVMDLLSSGHFNQIEPGIFDDIIRSLTDWGDYWLTCADFPSYVASQSQAAEAFRDRKRWVRSAVLNTASSGKFSTDRTIGDYNRDIWKLKPTVPGSR
jgi:glycogen phosphorylase